MGVPAGSEAFILDAHFEFRVLFEQTERNMAKKSKVLRTIIFTQSALILPKSNVKHPVQRVFNRPVRA